MRRMPLNASELEKFLFLSENFNFQNEEKIVNASQDKLYFKIVNEIIKNSKNSTFTPLIIFDKYNGNIYIGYVNDDSSAYAAYVASNTNSILEFEYHGDTDVLNIYLHDEVYVTEDYTKTIFGQDIVGVGNIKLYCHSIFFRGEVSSGSSYSGICQVISAKDTKVDSVQDLTLITNAINGTFIPCTIMEEGQTFSLFSRANALLYNGSIWQCGSVNSSGSLPTIQEVVFNLTNSINDVVTPISLSKN